MKRLRLTTILSTGGLLALTVGCGTNAKNLSADHFGDLSYRLPERRRPDEEQLASCGDGALTLDGRQAVRRRPFLQQVTPSSALVVFRASEPGFVEVTLPDGSPVAGVAATVDESVPASPSGITQLIAHIDGLQASTLYCYSLSGWTAPAGFRTAPASGSGQRVRFVAFGDSGDGTDTQYAVRDQLLDVPFDLMIHTGDVAYEHGTAAELDSAFFAVYAHLIAEFPVYPVAGNHDHATQDALPFRQAFVLPENGAPDGVETWYSFDWGDVHFVALDTERIGAVQAGWLDHDLSATDKPWKVVFGHRPPFSSGEHGSDGAFRNWFVPVIQKHGVQLVLNGHDHDYERTKPQSGTTYVVTGGGGVGTRTVGSSSFTAFAEDTLHYVQIEIHPDELFLHAIDATGVEFDSARIQRIR